MAKLYFRYGAMNSGKSTALLQAAYNYEERGQQVLLAKPAIDTKGASQIESRLGMTREVDFLIAAGESARELFRSERSRAQQDGSDIPVLAYGIRNDFLTHAFPGSGRLLAIAHTLEELKTICRCGRKAVFNGRRIGDRFVFDGDQVAIDGALRQAQGPVAYESLCGHCYLEESHGRLG